MAICLEQGANDCISSRHHCHFIISCFIKIQIGLTLNGCLSPVGLTNTLVVVSLYVACLPVLCSSLLFCMLWWLLLFCDSQNCDDIWMNELVVIDVLHSCPAGGLIQHAKCSGFIVHIFISNICHVPIHLFYHFPSCSVLFTQLLYFTMLVCFSQWHVGSKTLLHLRVPANMSWP